MTEISPLIELLKRCDAVYHNGGEPIMSDYDYDKLKTSTQEKYPEHPYFQTVGSTPTGDKVKLTYVLGSLEKMKYDGSMKNWLSVNPDIITLACSDKLDGCTIEVDYDGGVPIFATTRGDGYIGRNITEKAKVFCPVSNFKGKFSLKGEVLATTQKAKELGYKKSRTFVAGQLNADHPEHLDVLEVVFYLVLSDDFTSYEGHRSFVNDCGLPFVHFARFDAHISNIEDVLAEYYGSRKSECPWDVDGLVCTDFNDCNHQDEYYPSNAVAFKVNEDAVRTTVQYVQWEVKRSGKLQPVVYIEPVDISGSEVTKCTGFNYKFIRDNEISTLSEIGIVLSGEIIPYITDVYEPAPHVSIPTHCECGAKLGQTASGVDLVCLNPDCEGKILYKLENFLLSNGVEEITAKTIRKMGVNSIIELMELDEMDLMGIEGFGAGRVNTILEQLQNVYKTTPANLLKSFGITGLGKSTSADLTSQFSFDDLFNISQGMLIMVDGVGQIMADRIVNELPQYKEVYDYLVENGLTFEEKKGNIFQGKKVVLTGKSELKRNDLTKMIQEQGGMVKGISKGVDYLFTNSPNSTTTKMKKAQQYGIEINTYDVLYEMLGVEV